MCNKSSHCLCEEYCRIPSAFASIKDQKSWKTHGKVMEFYYRISVGTLAILSINVIKAEVVE